MHKIKVNPMATGDLIEIKDYITTELENPTAAVNVISNIICLICERLSRCFYKTNEKLEK